MDNVIQIVDGNRVVVEEDGKQIVVTETLPQVISVGQQGPAGKSSTWHTGSSAPLAAVGVDGDYFFNTSNGDVYRKVEGVWGSISNLRGPAGAGGNVFVHDQQVASASWTINHSLNIYPTVVVVDTANEVVVGDVTYVDLNNVQVSFAAPFSGKAYLQ